MGETLSDLILNNVRRRIAVGEVAVSMVVHLVQVIEIANIAKACGFDSLNVGLEHCSFSLETTSQISGATDAEQVVRNARFPSVGSRFVSVGTPRFRFRSWPFGEARCILNEETTVAAMIETLDAVERAGEIAAVKGVDILMIGINDLCAEMGIDGQFEHEKSSRPMAG